MRGSGEPAHVEPDLGEDHLCHVRPDAGDLVEAIHSAKCGVGHGVGRRAGGRAAGVRVDGLGVGHRRQQLIDAGPQGVDLGGQGIDLVQQHPREFGVMVVEAAIEGGEQSRVFGLHPAPRQPSEHLGIALSGDQRLDHGASGHARDVGGHRRQLDQASSSSFSSRCTCRERSWVRSVRSRV